MHLKIASFLVCVPCILSGCGTSAYDALLHQQVSALRLAAPFSTLYQPKELPDTPVQIRVPQAFKSAYLPDSAHPDDGARINKDRVQPPFLALPGFKVCYEGTAPSSEGALPFYCYLAAQPAKPGDAERIGSELLAQLKSKLKDTPEAWESVECPSPNGSLVSWKKIRVVGEQTFLMKQASNNNQVSAVEMPALFELWIHDAQQYVVLVGWRPGLH